MRSISIRLKLAVTLAASILTLITVVCLTFYANMRDTVRSQLMEAHDNVMQQYEYNIRQLTQTIDQVTLYIVMDSTLTDILHSDAKDPIVNIQNVKRLNRNFVDFIYVPLSMHLTDYSAAFYVNREMPFAAVLNSGAELSRKGVFSDNMVEALPWYRAATGKNGRLYWFTDAGDKHRLYTARLIKNPWPSERAEESEILGMAVIGFDTGQFGKLAERSKLTDNSKIILTSTDGTIIYSENDDHIGSRWSGGDVRRAADREMDTIEFEGKRYLPKIYPLEQGFSLVALISAADIEATVGGVRRTIFTIYIVAALISIALAWMIARFIAGPIKRLAFIMKGFKFESQLDTVVPSSSRDEIGLLYASFNYLMRRIQELMRDNDERRLQQRMAEIRALQAQINPHFIYNTLDSVNWLALGTGEKRLPAMVSSLVDILRYSIRESEQLVTVAEEIGQLRHYVTIQSIRYDGQFRFVVDVDPEVLKQRCPKLILQPLVENAIVHGGVGSGEGDLIRVHGILDNGVVRIKVSDNGVGADTETIQARLRDEEGRKGGAEDAPPLRHGVRNVHTRIKLHFGGAYGLHYENHADGRGITATITLPEARAAE